jgi:N-methylhydantoinase A
VIECRYVGQTHTLDIPLPEDIAPASLRQAFESTYKDRYTYLHPGADLEIVALRVRGEIPAPSVEFPDIDMSRGGAARNMDAAVVGSSRLRVDGRWLESPVYDRDALPIDAPVRGPALVVEDFATLYLPPDSMMHLDTKGHACIEVR